MLCERELAGWLEVEWQVQEAWRSEDGGSKRSEEEAKPREENPPHTKLSNESLQRVPRSQQVSLVQTESRKQTSK